jgi:hypothetical protein
VVTTGAALGAWAVDVDLVHGGRWTSLRSATGREWLWRRDEPRRARVAPGDAFADAGGMEECVPTVRGTPDHGEAWTREWSGDPRRSAVSTPEFDLSRSVTVAGDSVVVDYTLQSPRPGYRFVWAAHLLLDVSPGGRLICREGAGVRVFDGPDESWTYRRWSDDDLGRLGPDDGSALSAIVDTAQATVVDGGDRLKLQVDAPGQPCSIGVWRNLAGWPPADPYRSIGVEPMLGRVWDRQAAIGPADLAVTDGEGRAGWRLILRGEGPP